MNKKIQNAFIFCLALLTVVLLMKGTESWLDRRIESMYAPEEDTLAINQLNGNLTKDKGEILIQKALENDNLMLLGSSELDSWVGQNPMYWFPNNQLPDQITLIGHAYMQDLLHAMKVGTENFGHGEKVGIVISLQWFMGGDIDINGYAANFSEIQFYDTMSNPKLSKETKEKICSRTAELLGSIDGYEDIKVYTELYGSELGKKVLTVMKPYYSLKRYFLGLKDKWETYNVLKTTESMDQKADLKEVNWQELLESAEQEGKQFCTNNEFYVEDTYYTENLSDHIAELKDCNTEEMLESREMEDYEIFLQVCKENGVEPYLIFMCTNGWYYDYVGIDQDRRNQLYDKLAEKAEEYGFDYLRLSDHEYEPYFMLDVMHLGWKGWMYVNEELTEHFSDS